MQFYRRLPLARVSPTESSTPAASFQRISQRKATLKTCSHMKAGHGIKTGARSRSCFGDRVGPVYDARKGHALSLEQTTKSRSRTGRYKQATSTRKGVCHTGLRASGKQAGQMCSWPCRRPYIRGKRMKEKRKKTGTNRYLESLFSASTNEGS